MKKIGRRAYDVTLAGFLSMMMNCHAMSLYPKWPPPGQAVCGHNPKYWHGIGNYRRFFLAGRRRALLDLAAFWIVGRFQV